MTLLMTAKQPLQTISYVSKAVFKGQWEHRYEK